MSATRALIWEYVARGRWQFAATLFCCVALVGLLTQTTDGSDLDTLHFGFFWLELFLVAFATASAAGAPQSRFRLPVASRHIATCTTVCVGAAATALLVAINVVVNWLFDAQWPLWGPALIAGLASAWMFVVIWSTANSQGLQIIAGGLSAGVIIAWLGTRATGPIESHPLLPYDFVLQGRLASNPLFWIGGWLVTLLVGVVGFANLRRGNGIDLRAAVDWLAARMPRRLGATPFASADQGQFQIEWQERGTALPTIAAVLGAAGLITAALVPVELATVGVGIGSVLLMTTILVIGLFFGARSSDRRFGAFLASRPMRDDQIAAAVLKNVAASIGLTGLVAGTVGLLFLALANYRGIGDQMDSHNLTEPLAAAGFYLILAWTIVGLTTSATLGGNRVLSITWAAVIGSILVGAVLAALLPSPAADVVVSAYVKGCLLLAVLAVGVIYVVSWRRALISGFVLALPAVGILTVLAARLVVPAASPINDDILGLVLAGALPPLPLAAAPLAVWWNRHGGV